MQKNRNVAPPLAPKRVTIKDVARAAGVSFSTVASILRGEAHGRESTRARVRACADALGYRVNTMAAALAGQRVKKLLDDVPIALLAHHKSKANIHSLNKLQQFANSCGLRCDAISFEDPSPRAFRQLDDRMFARGIRGLIIGEWNASEPFPKLRWERYAVVTLSRIKELAAFDQVVQLKSQPVYALCEIARNRGYRRIGGALMRHPELLPDDVERLGALLGFQNYYVPPDHRVPPYLGVLGEPSHEDFLRWIDEHKPDIVLGFQINLYFQMLQAGYEIPAQIGFASLHGASAKHGVSGMSPNLEHRYLTAITLLERAIRAGRTGCQNHPQIVEVATTFHDLHSMPGVMHGA